MELSTIVATDENTISKSGKKIYDENKFMRALTNVMENPEFIYLIENHFDTWSNIEMMVMFFKLYQKIGDQFPDFTGYQKIYLVKSLIDNSETRRLICKEIHDSKLPNVKKQHIKKITQKNI